MARDSRITAGMSSTDIIVIIGAVSLGIVNIITALKVKDIAHSVNSAASASVAKIEALTAQVATLTAQLADEKSRRGRRHDA
jgi:2-phospho-L-lactate transferase/gluconeogenesis factor (CofD/UPF0052 family)